MGRASKSSLSAIKSAARETLECFSALRPHHAKALRVMVAEKSHRPHFVAPNQQHVDAAIAWIGRAQDAHNTGGVAWGFRARSPIRSKVSSGWVGEYPETTGYIIPTLLRYAVLNPSSDSVARARRMTDWELRIQLPSGGFQGGIYGSELIQPSTFVTGQVLLGLVAAFKEFEGAHIREAALRAGEYLLGCLDQTGRFVSGFSLFCAPGAKAYEVRTGLALAELGNIVGDKKFCSAASLMADYSLSVQQPNGWFAENDLDIHDRPLTHTIGYVLEGLHGIGNRLGRQDCIAAVRSTLDAMLPLISEQGFLAGRWRSDWSPAVRWACLTGSSQIAGVYLRMFRETGERKYFEAGKRLLGFVCFTQELQVGVPELDGGIRGSYPFSGAYGQWSVLNWATKFFADSVMDYLTLQRHAEGAQ